MRMHISSPKVPNAHAMQMHAQEETYLFIYFLQKVVSKTMRIGLR
jgi:hypothetical protein